MHKSASRLRGLIGCAYQTQGQENAKYIWHLIFICSLLQKYTGEDKLLCCPDVSYMQLWLRSEGIFTNMSNWILKKPSNGPSAPGKHSWVHSWNSWDISACDPSLVLVLDSYSDIFGSVNQGVARHVWRSFAWPLMIVWYIANIFKPKMTQNSHYLQIRWQ